MKEMRFILFLFFCHLAYAGDAPVILISMDGFRHDYPDHIKTPHIDRIFANGFRVKSMTPAFPSLTFPNHYTLVTGKHPHHHGIVGNKFFDSAKGEAYTMYEVEDVNGPQWYEAEAIWEVAKRAQIPTAAYFWVGSEMVGRQPDTFEVFDNDTPPDRIVAQLLRWLDPQTQPTPKLMLGYFSFVDSTGHLFGPDSPETVFAVKRMDQVLGDLLNGIEALGQKPNIVVVSDHGMMDLNGVFINYEDVAKALESLDIAYIANNYSQLDIYFRKPTKATIEHAMSVLPKKEGFSWYRREHLPYPTHPEKNGDIIGLADPGYVFQRGTRRSKYSGGHGYRPDLPEMGAVCFGLGPAFLADSQLASVHAVDVFPLLVNLLGLPQVPCDGSLQVWQPVLRSDK